MMVRMYGWVQLFLIIKTRPSSPSRRPRSCSSLTLAPVPHRSLTSSASPPTQAASPYDFSSPSAATVRRSRQECSIVCCLLLQSFRRRQHPAVSAAALAWAPRHPSVVLPPLPPPHPCYSHCLASLPAPAHYFGHYFGHYSHARRDPLDAPRPSDDSSTPLPKRLVVGSYGQVAAQPLRCGPKMEAVCVQFDIVVDEPRDAQS